ncbi:MAG: pyruvate kinase [Clostridia bacterium]|nr:pyruvate kinase [Clostridia bacterium]
MRKTKIICTLGPAVEDEHIMRSLIIEGMDVARLNFSHGSHEEHLKRVQTLKKVREEMKKPVALLLDTKGPEIRLGCFENGGVQLNANERFILTTEECLGTAERGSVTYKNLPEVVNRGARILMDDGLIELKVLDTTETDIICKVMNSGPIKDKKSLNVPGVRLDMPYLSPKDVEDILFAIKNDFDYIAASFTRTATDIIDIRKLLEENGGQDIHIIAKIENCEGVENADEILMASDGIMVARGDMGVEIDYNELPRIQKMLIKKAMIHGKKSITATQMLDSMISKPRPTRAEISDIANAIYDGTSAIMLSGETSIGKYPIESVRTMAKIAVSTESAIHYKKRFNQMEVQSGSNVTNAISHATCTTANDLDAAAIITVTKTGSTARMISKYRPECPIISCTTNSKVYRQLAMSWGVVPLMFEEKQTSDELFEHAVEKATEAGLVKCGDLVVITAGLPLGIPGTTNILKVHIVGNILIRGLGVNQKSATGTLCVCKNEEEAMNCFNGGEILVIPETSNKLMSILRRAKAIITERGDLSSHAAIVGLSLDIPVICGAAHATEVLRSGTTVTVDATTGLVFSGMAAEKEKPIA